MSGSQSSPYPILVIGLLGALVTAVWFYEFKTIRLTEIGPEEVASVFMVLIFVALVIERTTEVYVNTSLEPEREKKLTGIRTAEAKVRTARAALDAERTSAAPRTDLITKLEYDYKEEVTKLKGEWEKAAQTLVAQRARIRQRSGTLAAFLGILVAVSGVRTLAPFLPDTGFPPDTCKWQQVLFAGTDVLITGALLAGGSDGLHQIVQRFLEIVRPTHKLG